MKLTTVMEFLYNRFFCAEWDAGNKEKGSWDYV